MLSYRQTIMIAAGETLAKMTRAMRDRITILVHILERAKREKEMISLMENDCYPGQFVNLHSSLIINTGVVRVAICRIVCIGKF